MKAPVANRLLEYAQELEDWLEGRRPVPTAGPPVGLRMALRACAVLFRWKAHGVDGRTRLVARREG